MKIPISGRPSPKKPLKGVTSAKQDGIPLGWSGSGSVIRDHSDDVAYEQAHVREFGEKLSRKSEVKPCCGTWRWPKGPRSGNLLTSSRPHSCFRASSSLRASSLGRSSASGASSRVYIVGKECKRTTAREASYSSHHARLMSSGNVNIMYWLFTDPVSLPVLQEIMEHDGTLMLEKSEIVSINCLLRDTS